MTERDITLYKLFTGQDSRELESRKKVHFLVKDLEILTQLNVNLLGGDGILRMECMYFLPFTVIQR